MKKNIEEVVDELVKSMHKTYSKMKKKDPIKDVLDLNTVAQANPKDIPPSKTGVMNKAKIDQGLTAGQKKKIRASRNEDFTPHKKEKFTTEGKRPMPKPVDQKELKQKLKNKPKQPTSEDLEYPMAASESCGVKKFEKTEDFVKNMVEGFKKISKSYLEKQKNK